MLAGSLLPQFWERRRAKASARAMARAYISGILKMEEVRNHSRLYHVAIDALRAGVQNSLPRITGAEDYPNDEVRKALISQLGLFGPEEASDLVQFYNMLDALRIDLKAIALGQWNEFPIGQQIAMVAADQRLWEDTQQLGRYLIKRLG